MEKENLLEKELSAATELGFKNREEFVEEAVRTYLAARKDVRILLAATLYKEEKISLGKAIEMSGVNIEEFKDYLKEKGIGRKTSGAAKSNDNALKYYNKINGRKVSN